MANQHNHPLRENALQAADIAVIGSIILDLSVYADLIPKPGETLTGKRFILGHGGKGANQCVMAKLLGANVTLIGKVGKDAFGMDYIQDLRARNISTYHIYVTDQASTGVAQITVNSSGENSIIVVPGANLLLTEDDVAKASFSLRSAKVVLCQLEVDLSADRFAMKTAYEHGATCILNTAPIPDGFTLEDEIFNWVHIVCSNEHEAKRLAGTSECATPEQALHCAKRFQARSSAIKWAIVTMGARGVLVFDCAKGDSKFVPAVHVEAVDTTGAGDAFMGSLAYFIAYQPDLDMFEMVRRCSIIAADSVTRVGTQISYPARADLDPSLFQ